MAEPMSLNRLTFLVVDDLELMRTVTINQLRALGCEKVLAAKNGADALRMLRAHKVDAILSDWNMPVMNGIEFLKVAKQDENLKLIPVVVLTTSKEEKDKAKEQIEGKNNKIQLLSLQHVDLID